MNEKIKELAEQAMSATFNKFSGVEWSAEEWRNFYDAKFAELIVRECIVKAEEEAERYLGFPNLENANMYAKVMYNYQELLKENFGVEE